MKEENVDIDLKEKGKPLNVEEILLFEELMEGRKRKHASNNKSMITM